MRLYVNDREIDALKDALRNNVPTAENRGHQEALLERVELCCQLQGSVQRAKQPK